MKNYIEEVKKMASDYEESPGLNEDVVSPAIKILFDITESGANTLGSNGVSSVKIHRMPADLVPLFFHFETSGGGFILSTKNKFTFFMQSADNKIFIFGKNKRNGPEKSINDKIQQLFNIDITDNNGNISFFDSTKKEIKAEEIVLLALRWSLN